MKIVFKFKFLTFIIGFVFTVNTVLAQGSAIIDDSIFSNVLNEQRKIKIYLPEEYRQDSNTKFDVVYLVDGEIHFNDFLFIYKFAKNENFLPPLILIAVPNKYTSDGNMRDRDFLPEKTADNLKAGGADNFIAFLKNELIPYINKKLPASGDNSLFGHSLGGFFTMYVLLKEPGLFANYYCSDPAFPWNNRRIISMAENTFRSLKELNNTLWIIGVEETYKNVGIAKMDTILGAMAPIGLNWKTSIYQKETHMSVRLKGIYDGLKNTYDGYNSKKMVEFHPNNGSLLEGKPAPVFLNGSFPDVYYTIDGSEPEASSKPAPQMIEITAPAKLKVKWLGQNKKYIMTSEGNFELSKEWPALQNVQDIKAGAVRYSYYEGKWETLPDFTKLKAVKTGYTDSSFSLADLPAKSNFACVFEGFLKIDKEGYYSFALCSSDGSKFFISGREIINNDGLHGSDWYKSYVVPLQKGFYPARIEYFQREGSRHLDLLYISPITNETVNVTFKMMYYK
ncbi:MAG: chitobiase/beta-hexosaminidase C-terminal domain-containing protein [Bacteroidales bacterium]|nr:chitobiase/beta-hexosaminidase C-terminal domain-containing protein [Bacteroidales bacterium]